jgi:hypothetical protein
MKNKPLISIILASFLLSSCATILTGKTQYISLQADRSGKDVEVEIYTSMGKVEAKLPTTISVQKADRPLLITVKETKCLKESKTYSVPRYNIIMVLGGLFGTFTDMQTGAAWEYDKVILVRTKEKNNKTCD